jgi:CheY-like chemotaxis protein
VTAPDGRAAIDAVAAAPADVILLDLEMPVMDGIEAAVRVRELERASDRPRAVIIGLSAHHDDATRARCLAAGCDVYLTKPVSRAVLLRTVHDAVTSARVAPSTPVVPVAPQPETPAVGPDDPVAIDPALADSVGQFLGSRRAALDELAAALDAGERGPWRRLAHKLAGSFGLYGFTWAAAACDRMAQQAEHAERAQLTEMLAALRRHLETVDVQCGDAAVTKGDPADGVTRAPARRG